MKKILILLVSLVCLKATAQVVPNKDVMYKGQVSVGKVTPTSPSAWLELGSEGTDKGFLTTRVANTGAIVSPVRGLFVYSIATNSFWGRTNVGWVEFAIGSGFVKYSDTASMLDPYTRLNEVQALLTPYLLKTDTTAMLVPYVRDNEMTAALLLELNVSDTAAMLGAYMRKNTKYVDSLGTNLDTLKVYNKGVLLQNLLLPASSGTNTLLAQQIAVGSSINTVSSSPDFVFTNQQRFGINVAGSPNATVHVTQKALTTITNANGTHAPMLLNLVGTAGGNSSYSIGTVSAGDAGDINILGGDGGNILGTPTVGNGGFGADVNIIAGRGGLGTTQGGYGGNAILQGGDGGTGTLTGVPGFVALKGGSASIIGNGVGGPIFLTPGQGHGTGQDGTIFLGLSPSYTLRGNTVIGATTDDYTNRFQVTGGIRFFTLGDGLGTRMLTVSATGVVSAQAIPTGGGGSGTPNGADGDLQWKDGSDFAGGGPNWNNTTKTLTVPTVPVTGGIVTKYTEPNAFNTAGKKSFAYKEGWYPYANGDGTYNNVWKRGFNIDGAEDAAQWGLFEAIEPLWNDGGVFRTEWHRQLYIHSTQIRIQSNTITPGANLTVADNQQDFRATKFFLSDLLNNSYFYTSKSNGVNTQVEMGLSGFNPVIKWTNTDDGTTAQWQYVSATVALNKSMRLTGTSDPYSSQLVLGGHASTGTRLIYEQATSGNYFTMMLTDPTGGDANEFYMYDVNGSMPFRYRRATGDLMVNGAGETDNNYQFQVYQNATNNKGIYTNGSSLFADSVKMTALIVKNDTTTYEVMGIDPATGQLVYFDGWKYPAPVAGNPFADNTDLVKGSGDATKLLRFEVDGFPTATTRTLTPQDANYTIAGINLAQTFTGNQTFSNNVTISSLAGTGDRPLKITSAGLIQADTYTEFGNPGGSAGQNLVRTVNADYYQVRQIAVTGNGTITQTNDSLLTINIAGYTFQSGLTNSSGTVRWTGALTQNATITTGGTYQIDFSGANASAVLFNVNNTGSAGTAIAGTSTDAFGVRGTTNTGAGVYGISNSTGTGVYGFSSSGNALGGQSSTGLGLQAQVVPASTNTVITVGTFERYSSGTAANGLGGSMDFVLETSSGGGQTSNRIISTWTDVTNGTRTSEMTFTGMNSAASTNLLTLSGNGDVKLNQYGSGSKTGTLTYLAGFNSSGKVIEIDPITLGGGGSFVDIVEETSGSVNENVAITIADNRAGKIIYDIVGWDPANSRVFIVQKFRTFQKQGGTLSAGAVTATGQADEITAGAFFSADMNTASNNFRVDFTAVAATVHWKVTYRIVYANIP